MHGDNAEREDGAIFGDYLNDALNEVVENELPHQGVHVRESELEIRRIRDRKIESYRAARRLGRDIDADVVLWGKSDCQMPKGAEVILRGRGRNTRIVGGKAALRNVDRVDIDVEGGATGTAQDLDVSGSVRRPQYAVCTYAAMVKWHIGGKRDRMTEPRPRDEVANIPFGELALGQPGLVIDLVLGLHFAKRYEPKTARPFLQSAAATVQSRPDLFELALWIAGTESALGYKEPARIQYEAILATCVAQGNIACEAGTLNNIGSVYDDLGDKKKALAFYNQALPLLQRDVGDRAGEATTLNNIGRVYDDLGDKKKALAFYNQALPLRRDVGDRAGEATTLNNIGGVYSSLGDKKKALAFYNQALPLRRDSATAQERPPPSTTSASCTRVATSLATAQDVGDRATALNNIGSVYDNLGDKKKALAFYNQALPLQRDVGDRAGEATTLNNIGLVYSSLGDKKKALAFYNQALPLRRDVGDRAGEATTLSNIGRVYDGPRRQKESARVLQPSPASTTRRRRPRRRGRHPQQHRQRVR